MAVIDDINQPLGSDLNRRRQQCGICPATFNEDFTVRVDGASVGAEGDSDEDKLPVICMSKSPETQRQWRITRPHIETQMSTY